MFKIGIGYDIHKIEMKENSIITLGGISIAAHYKIIAHSDGDVLIHAIVDAILGAIGLGDIGDHFPPHNDKFKDMQSVYFLKKIRDMLCDNNATIINIDTTIIAESPKLYSYKHRMSTMIAQILEISDKVVNVKATTNEGLDAIGAMDGIAAHAVCMVEV